MCFLYFIRTRPLPNKTRSRFRIDKFLKYIYKAIYHSIIFTMSYFYTQLVRKFACLVCFTFLSYTSFSQAGWTALITVTNLVQTDANTFEYEVYITNNGPVNYAIAGYSWGMNMTPGIANGGTLQDRKSVV